MSDDARNRPSLPADDLLPPVEPPSAGFILQLFVVPGIIVTIIIAVWLMFNYLAQMGNNSDVFIRDLQRNNDSRWQAAINLASALREERDHPNALRDNAELAQKLAGILDKEIANGAIQDQLKEKPVALRVYLCYTLGQFRVPDGLPVLLKAIATNRDPAERDVRRAAIHSAALLLDKLRQGGKLPPETAVAGPALVTAADDSDELVREAAAYALGTLGDWPAQAKLMAMLDDPYPNARFNAATGLARWGNAGCVRVLDEMLDPNETSGADSEQDPKLRESKQVLIVTNALRAIKLLVAANPSADLGSLTTKVDELASGKLQYEGVTDMRQMILDAEAVQKQLRALPQPASDSR